MSDPIRVLRVIARLNVGGPALHVSYLTRGLDERGYETTLVAGQVGPEEGSMEYAVREQGIEPLFVPALQRDIAVGADFGAVRELRRLIRELRPDILHTHTAKAGAVGRMAAVLSGSARPRVVVHTFHGHVLRGYFDRGRTSGFLSVERSLARVTDKLVAVSPQVRDELVALGVAPADRFEVIRLGLELDRRLDAPAGAREEQRRELGIADDAFVVAWLGRMTSIKRVEDLLHAFARVAAAEPRAELVLAGDGPLRDELQEAAASLGLADRAHFVGMQRDVARLYAAADLVALCSANEGTPVSLIEALAAGKPVVSTDVGGVSDVVRAGTSGLLVPRGDVEALADAILLLVRDDELRARLAAAAPADVRERYSVERLVDDVDGLYRRLLAPSEARGLRKPTSPAPLVPALPDRNVGTAPRRLRILLLSQYFPPEVGATQSRMQAFAEHLSARGHDVTVIAEFPNHPHGVIPPEYRGRLYEDDRSNPYRVIRVWVKASEEKTQRTRMNFYLSYMALATAMAPVVGNVDVVVATSPPLFTGIAGAALARLNRAPFVLDVRDLWPSAAVSLDQIPSHAAIRASEALERRLYREAAVVTAVTQPFCEHIDRIRKQGRKTVLLPNGTLDLFFEAVEPGDARERLTSLDGQPLITFAGTLGIAQALLNVLDAAALTRESVQWALVGDGPMKERLLHTAAKLGVDNVRFVPQVPLEDVPPLLAASDALLVTLSGHSTFEDFVPSKLIDFMAAGKPVLLSARGESVRLLERAGAGVAVDPEDPQALADAATWLGSHPDETAEMGARGRAFARGRLRGVQAARLEALLLEIARR